MPGWVFAVIVVAFLAVAIPLVRRSFKGAILERLPLAEGEQVLLEEEGLKVSSRAQKRAARGGWTVTYKVRAVLTDRRIILATGGPEGKHKFVITAIIDYTTPARPVSESGYPAYLSKFQLGNGYPTYALSAADLSVAQDGSDTELRVVVPFPEGGPSWGPPPEVRIVTSQAERYHEAIATASRRPTGRG
jgi:hypothetical protein